MDVDESGRDGESGGIDGAGGGASGQPAHGGDFPLADGDIPDVGGVAGAIDDTAVVDQEIEILCRRERPQQEEEHPKFHIWGVYTGKWALWACPAHWKGRKSRPPCRRLDPLKASPQAGLPAPQPRTGAGDALARRIGIYFCHNIKSLKS